MVWMRARALLSRHIVATVLLGVLVGVAAAVPLAAWAGARRTADALPGFLRETDPAAFVLFFCPEDVDPASGDAAREACNHHDQSTEFDAVRELPPVREAGRVTFVAAQAQRGDDDPVFAGLSVGIDPSSLHGGGLMLAGRRFDDTRDDEIVISEGVARSSGLRVGDRITITPYMADQADCAGEGSCAPAGDRVPVAVVGIIRGPADLSNRVDHDGEIYVSPAFWGRHDGPDMFRYGLGIVVWPEAGATADDIEAAIRARWPGRYYGTEPTLPDEVNSLDDTIGYQVRAAQAFAIVAGVAALVFASQAVARQARRESLDVPVLRAMGASRAQVGGAAALRAAASGIIAVVTACLATIAASPIAPFGIAGRTVADRTVSADLVVLALGLPLVLLAAVLFGTLPAVAATHMPIRASAATAPLGRATAALGLPATAVTGAASALTRRGRAPLTTALAGSAIAIAAVIASAVMTTSLIHVIDTPPEYGVAWDVVAGNVDSPETEVAAQAAVAQVPGIVAAAGLQDDTATIDHRQVPLLAFVAVPGVRSLDPVVTIGRPPSRGGEIALGATTMRELDARVGDEVELTMPSGGVVRARVVGRALLNNTFELEPGVGGVVDATWLRELDGGQAQQIAVQLADGADGEHALAMLRDAFPNSVDVPPPSTGIRNLQTIDNVPWLLAAAVSLLAAAAVVHALLLSISARRRELSVLRSLGFTRRQVVASVGWQATVLAGAAVVVGVPLGVIIGRLGWSAVARNVGLDAGAVVPLVTVPACVVGVVVLINVFAFPTAVAAARVRPAAGLRAE